MKTLVTGGAGFFGAHLCRRLASDGHEVIALDVRDSPRQLDVAGIRYLQADLRSLDEWRDNLKDVDVVFHLASVHLQVTAAEEEYRDVNVHAAVALAAACPSYGVARMIHASTVGIYGHVASPPASEDAPRQPTNPYERTKLEGEEAVAREADRSGLDLRVLRPAWIFGPGCPRTAKLLRSIRRRRFFFIGRDTNLRHPIYVSDAVDAFVAAATVARAPRHDHIIAGPSPMTLREIVDACASVLGVASPRLRLPRTAALTLGAVAELGGRVLGINPPFSRRSLAFFENDNAFDISAAKQDLGFVPQVGFADGLQRTLADVTWTVGL